MGSNQSAANFVLGIKEILGMTELTWESKLENYNMWCWSGEDVVGAFQKHPWCVMMSEEKDNGCDRISY